MPTTGFLQQLDVVTAKKLLPGIVDLVFVNDPLLADLKQNSLEKWSGNAVQDAFIYNTLPQGFYAKGDAFNITQPQTEQAMTWQPKFGYVDASLFLEDVEVTNAGPEAVIKLADSRLQQCALNMSALLAVAQYRHGQSVAAEDRSLKIQGLEEALTDATSTTWNGNVFPNYGTVPRAQVNGALNSPYSSSFISGNIAGAITYDALEKLYNSVVIGNEKPNLMVTTNLGMSYIKMKFQPQQRFETDNPSTGFTGLKFNGGIIYQSQYCPGQVAPPNATALGFATPSSGETMWFLNKKYLKFWVSTSPKFGFGFTGWKPAQDNNTIAGQYLYGGPGITTNAPRYHRQAFGITG